MKTAQAKIGKSSHNMLLTHIESFLSMTSASAYWKERNGKYLGVNDNFLQVAALQRHDQVEGISDVDLLWKDYASLMMENDRHIVASELVNTFIEPSIAPNGESIHYLSHKTPLRNQQGKVIGTFGLSYRLESESWNNDRINEISVLLGEKATGKVRQFLLKHQQKTHSLSNRQIDCLSLLTKGMTVKQIASSLSLSPRTVEHYLATVRDKLNCETRSELVQTAFKLGIKATG